MHRFVLFTILPMWQHCYCLYFKGRPLAFRARRRARMCDGIPKGHFVFGRPRPFTPPVLSLQKRVSPPSPPCTYPNGAPSHLLYLPHFRLHSPPPHSSFLSFPPLPPPTSPVAAHTGNSWHRTRRRGRARGRVVDPSLVPTSREQRVEYILLASDTRGDRAFQTASTQQYCNPRPTQNKMDC